MLNMIISVHMLSVTQVRKTCRQYITTVKPPGRWWLREREREQGIESGLNPKPQTRTKGQGQVAVGGRHALLNSRGKAKTSQEAKPRHGTRLKKKRARREAKQQRGSLFCPVGERKERKRGRASTKAGLNPKPEQSEAKQQRRGGTPPPIQGA